jgi:hypothetical protein
VRVSKVRGTDNNSSVKDSAVGPTERHFHSEPAILPIFVQVSSLGVLKTKILASRKPRNMHILPDSCAEPDSYTIRLEPTRSVFKESFSHPQVVTVGFSLRPRITNSVCGALA